MTGGDFPFCWNLSEKHTDFPLRWFCGAPRRKRHPAANAPLRERYAFSPPGPDPEEKSLPILPASRTIIPYLPLAGRVCADGHAGSCWFEEGTPEISPDFHRKT
ncbi:hypothetical protein B4135_2880 [Caldibacillus debilis]|uniref:Uncharacterized protein n=1 Tax=Caldibacillus debilis TaxID=301148 RepID=A0A150LPN8_9BACI|nr:hypothetical protein B4135_2880 [Caldibacillus debilis]